MAELPGKQLNGQSCKHKKVLTNRGGNLRLPDFSQLVSRVMDPMEEAFDSMSVDVLNWLLDSIHVQIVMTERSELQPPWDIRADPGTAAFYVVVCGRCSLELDGMRELVTLCAGDVAVAINKQGGCYLRNSPDGVSASPVRLGENTEGRERASSPVPESGLRTTLVWSEFKWEEEGLDPLLHMLPRVIHIKGEDGRPALWLNDTVRLIVEESAFRKPGAQTIINHLCHIIVVQVLRAHLSAARHDSDQWLAAVSDAQIGPALALIHTRPEISWTVASLARSCGMSRSAFALRFARLVGRPPKKYLVDRRMLRARKLLRESRLSLKEICDLVGYRSEAALSNAFKKCTGVAPAIFRTSCRCQGGAASAESVQSAPSASDRGSADRTGFKPAH